jgi:hypothetical protein
MFRTTRTMLAVAATVAFAVPAFAGPPTATTTTLTFSKNPADVGDAVTVTGTVTAVGGPVEGKIRIKQYLCQQHRRELWRVDGSPCRREDRSDRE